jgi:hypothetical protein
VIEKVISGGQSGSDQAGLRAARAAGIPTGGTAAKGWETEDGPAPWLKDFGLVECPIAGYPPRTRFNVADSCATVIFDTSAGKDAGGMSRGTQLAIRCAMEYGRPNVVARVELGRPIPPKRPAAMAGWIAEHRVRVLNVAGQRESKARGIGAWVESYLAEVFRILANGATP